MSEAGAESPPLKRKKIEKIGDYVVGRTLGKGSFGKVKYGVHVQSKKPYALKFVETSRIKSEKEKLNMYREIRIQKLLNHENIVKIEDVIESQDVTCIVMQYVGGRDLLEHIVANGRLKEREACSLFRQMISGIEYCHSNFVIHRDLKPENILMNETLDTIKINDFGLSNFMKPGSLMETFCGSPLYASPEIIRKENYIGPEIDVWSLGVILYTMVTGLFPWNGKDPQQQLQNALKGRCKLPEYLSEECGNLIKRMLEPDPKQRATIAEIRLHPWTNTGYLMPPPSCLPERPRVRITEVDHKILKQLEILGFPFEVSENCILNNKKTTQSYVLYHLLLDYNKRNPGSEKKMNSEGRRRSLSQTDVSLLPPPITVKEQDEEISEVKSYSLLQIFMKKRGPKKPNTDEKKSPQNRSRSFYLFERKSKSPVASPSSSPPDSEFLFERKSSAPNFLRRSKSPPPSP